MTGISSHFYDRSLSLKTKKTRIATRSALLIQVSNDRNDHKSQVEAARALLIELSVEYWYFSQ